MKNKLKIGITFDVKEDYNINTSDWKHSDFSTLADITFVKEKIERNGHKVSLIGDYKKCKKIFLDNKLSEFDLIFNTVEGFLSRNREGLMPSFFELNQIPYTGSDAYCVNLALNKMHTNIIAEYLNICTPKFHLIESMSDISDAFSKIDSPWILKPNYEGSSSGVQLVYDKEEFVKTVEKLLKMYKQPILCEQYIDGREVVVSQILDDDRAKVVGAAEIVRVNGKPIGIYNSSDKFTDHCKKIKADFSLDTLQTMYDNSLKLHKYLGCCDYSRTDFRITPSGQVYFLEITPLPSIGPNSGFVKCCEFAGITFEEALEIIIENAINRFKNKTYKNR